MHFLALLIIFATKFNIKLYKKTSKVTVFSWNFKPSKPTCPHSPQQCFTKTNTSPINIVLQKQQQTEKKLNYISLNFQTSIDKNSYLKFYLLLLEFKVEAFVFIHLISNECKTLFYYSVNIKKEIKNKIHFQVVSWRILSHLFSRSESVVRVVSSLKRSRFLLLNRWIFEINRSRENFEI
jgi:hypothetical protein